MYSFHYMMAKKFHLISYAICLFLFCIYNNYKSETLNWLIFKITNFDILMRNHQEAHCVTFLINRSILKNLIAVDFMKYEMPCIKLVHSHSSANHAQSLIFHNKPVALFFNNQHSVKQCMPRWICHALKNNLHIICHARDIMCSRSPYTHFIN